MSPFLLISIGIGAAALFGLVARAFKQPPVVGYLLGGLVLGLAQITTGQHIDNLQLMGQLGVTLLLFLVGLEMNLKELKIIGKVVILGGVGQILFTTIFGFLVSRFLGFDLVASLYIAVALTFSSTIVVIKLLSEKKDLDSLYGKISVGFLIVQDIVAILALVVLSGFQFGEVTALSFASVFAKGFILLVVVGLLSKYVLPKFFDWIAATSSELLFVGSIAWVLLAASIVSTHEVGFTPEIGGLLAGVALANSSSHLQIASRVRPLRDFFVTIFFLILGIEMASGITPHVIVPSIVLSLFVIFGGPIIVLAVLGVLGHKKRTSFLVAVTFAQVSEFSLVLVAVGQKIGHINQEVVSIVTLVAVITIIVSTYLIMNGYKLYQQLSKILSLFEKNKPHEKSVTKELTFEGHIILIGCHRLGQRVLPILQKRKEPLVVVDFNPTVIAELSNQEITAFYGDATDLELLESLNLKEAKMVISTTGSMEDNLFLLEAVSILNKKPLMVFSAHNAQDAQALYAHGADYVVVPQIAGGDTLAHIISAHGLATNYYKGAKERNLNRLSSIGI